MKAVQRHRRKASFSKTNQSIPEVPNVDKNAPLKFEEDIAREEKIVPNKKAFIIGGIIFGLITLLTIWVIFFYIKISKE